MRGHEGGSTHTGVGTYMFVHAGIYIRTYVHTYVMWREEGAPIQVIEWQI